MNLTRVDAALEDCKKHLDATQTTGTEIEAILTAYVSAVIYAAFEAEVRNTIAERVAAVAPDDGLGNFAAYAAKRLMRSIKIGDLAAAAGWFHGDCKTQFHQALDAEAHNAWDTIINNRHGVAHDDGGGAGPVSNLTFRELQVLYPKALEVLQCLEVAVAAKAGT